MVKSIPLGLEEALKKTLENISPLGTETVGLDSAVDRIAAEDLVARVDSPSIHASMKDGYAIRSGDVAGAELTKNYDVVVFPDADTNVLTNDAWDPLSGTAEFKATAVNIERI